MGEGKEEGTNSLPPQERREADKHYGGSNVQDQGVARAEFVLLSVIFWEMTGDSWLLCFFLSHPQPVHACVCVCVPNPSIYLRTPFFYYFAAISDHLSQLFYLLFI